MHIYIYTYVCVHCFVYDSTYIYGSGAVCPYLHTHIPIAWSGLARGCGCGDASVSDNTTSASTATATAKANGRGVNNRFPVTKEQYP